MTKMHEKGRNGDSMLVHMNPAEVGGLAALAEAHGRSMTVNPETGYPEAFSLGDILPTLVGIGASAATGGAAAPWLVGGATGLTSYATTGSLEKGLMSGLTAGGLNALGNNLAAAGAGEAASAGSNFAANNPTANAVLNGPANVAQSGAPSAIMAAKPPTPPMGAMGPGASPKGGLLSGTIQNPMDKLTQVGKGIESITQGGQWGEFAAANKAPIAAAGMGIAGQKAIADQERMVEEREDEERRDKREGQKEYMGSVNQMASAYDKYDRNMPLSALTGSPNYNPRMANFARGGAVQDTDSAENNRIYQDIAMSYANAGREVPGRLQQYLPMNNRIAQSPGGSGPFASIRAAGPMGGMQQDYAGIRNAGPMGGMQADYGNTRRAGPFGQFFQGSQYTGLPGLEGRNQDWKMPEVSQKPKTIQPQMQGPRQMVASPESVLSGGIGNLPQAQGGQPQRQMVADTDKILSQIKGPPTKKAEGGSIAGPGDGMSDDIMTTINGDDPAALSDGEFVIPADVVSHLGNGSSDAGAKVLYDMLDRVRKARTGKKTQGKEIEPDRMMPK